jgi:hypothetical protein
MVLIIKSPVPYATPFTAVDNTPDCNLRAATLIDRTKTCKVGVIGNIISLRHPLAVAS